MGIFDKRFGRFQSIFACSFYLWCQIIPNFVLVLKLWRGFSWGLRGAQSQNYHYFYWTFDFSEILSIVSHCYCKVIHSGRNLNIRKGPFFILRWGDQSQNSKYSYFPTIFIIVGILLTVIIIRYSNWVKTRLSERKPFFFVRGEGGT